MAIILDADVIIHGEKGVFDLGRWLAANETKQFEVAAITIAELWHGVERASTSQRAAREQYLRMIITPLPIIPYTSEIAYEHARIWAELSKQGKAISPYDLIVAATALVHGSQVATFNERHFGLVEGLEVVVPS